MWSKIFAKEYNSTEWLFMKISTMVILLLHLLFTPPYATQPYPVGICKHIDCSIIGSPIGHIGLLIVIVVLAVLYIAEKHMAITTFLLGMASVVYFTLEESNGIHNRCSLFSVLLFAQCIAYIFHQYGLVHQINKYRIHFSVQAVAAVYTLAALSKLEASGFSWISDTPNMALQVLKSFNYAYFDTGNLNTLNQGIAYSNWLLEHSLLIQIMLGSAFFLELFCVIALVNRRVALVYGLLLLGMHIGILYLMDIMITLIVFPMVIYLLNPLYLVSVCTQYFKGKR